MPQRIGLRERKFAKTRLALAEALVKRLEQAPLEEIVVRDLAEAAEVSEATFFNYFPRKSDLLDYYTQLWMLDLNWRCCHGGAKGLAAVAASFEVMAAAMQRQPGVMAEIIARQVLQRSKPEPVEITPAERLIAYPGHEGIEALPIGGIDKAWLPALEQAVRGGELPANSHLPTIMVGLAAIFYGVPMVLGQGGRGAIGPMYRNQLALHWAGVRGMGRG